MSTTIPRYLISSPTPSAADVGNGLRTAANLARETSQNRITMITPTKSQLERGLIVDALGTHACASLLRGQALRVSDDLTLAHRTERLMNTGNVSGVVLVVYGRPALLDKVDGLWAIKGMVVVPWMESDVVEWRQAWNPTIVGTPMHDDKAVTIDNPVVERALESLTTSVNLSTGLAHQTDRDSAVQLLKLLWNAGEHFESASIRAWALRNGWSPKGANELRDIADAIIERRRIRSGSTQVWRHDIVDYFRKEVEGDHR